MTPDPATVVCECCEQPLPPGTPAKIDRESGVIICNDCFEALTARRRADD